MKTNLLAGCAGLLVLILSGCNQNDASFNPPARQNDQVVQATLNCSLIAGGAKTGFKTIATQSEVFQNEDLSESAPFAVVNMAVAADEDILVVANRPSMSSNNQPYVLMNHQTNHGASVKEYYQSPLSVSNDSDPLGISTSQYTLMVPVDGGRLGNMKTDSGEDSGDPIIVIAAACRTQQN